MSEGGTTQEKIYYQGYEMIGTIRIPKTNLECPILEEVTKGSIEVAVAKLYPPGVQLNQVGNIVISGHNYRNGTFFSNNKQLEIGDVIYITDITGTQVAYTIYNIYETNSEDAEYITRDTNGAREISLTTCTDESDNQRLIIWARES